MRVSVVGTSCSGKTTTAAMIAQKLGVKHVELDALHWRPGWTEAPDDEFREAVQREAAEEQWVIDGNYRVVRDIVWGMADTVVWLDLPFHTLFRRALTRTLWRMCTGEELWNGNTETLRNLFSVDSIPLWVIRTYRRRRGFPALIAKPEYAHLSLVTLRNQREIDQWVHSLSPLEKNVK